MSEKQSYEDIINLPHPVSKKHPSMALSDRAAQFSPFAALTGYEEVVEEAARLTESYRDLDEEGRKQLDQKFLYIQSRTEEIGEVSITYFQPDFRKEGGSYLEVIGVIKKMDIYNHQIRLMDGTELEMEWIQDITNEMLQKLFEEDSIY